METRGRFTMIGRQFTETRRRFAVNRAAITEN